MGCREAAGRADLVRLAVVGGAVVADPDARLPGRGAWVHPRRACLARALERGVLPRAFRRPVTVPDETVDLFS